MGGISSLFNLDTLFNQNPLLDLITREPDPSAHGAEDLDIAQRDSPGELTQSPSQQETVAVPGTSTLSELTQNNMQNNTQTNNQNTFNVTVNNTYGEGVGFGGRRGGGGGGRCWWGCGSYCPFLLILLVVLLVIVVAAAYGITTFWNNTVTSIQSSFSSLTSFISLGYFATSSAKKPEPSTTITFGKATPSIKPTPIVPFPSGIIKAIDDVDHWVSLLADWPGAEAHLSANGVFWGGEGSIGFEDVGGFRDAWIILSEDLRRLEKRLQRVFAPIDKDMSRFLDDLRRHPATKRWHRQASRPAWQKLLGYLPWSDKSPLDVLYANHKRAKTLCSRPGIVHEIITVDTANSIKSRLRRLSEGACGLRDSIEKTGDRLAWAGTNDREGFGDGVSTVVSRGNLLCDIFVRAELRMEKLQKTVLEVDDSSQMPEALATMLGSLIVLGNPRHELLRKVEEDLGEWIEKLAEPVRKLHRLEFD